MWGVLCVLGLSGCGFSVWENYAQPQYGRERANRICHPYTHCTQGAWVVTDKVSRSVNAAYVMCEDKTFRGNDEWSQDLVSFGLEMNRCMKKKGYRFERE